MDYSDCAVCGVDMLTSSSTCSLCFYPQVLRVDRERDLTQNTQTHGKSVLKKTNTGRFFFHISAVCFHDFHESWLIWNHFHPQYLISRGKALCKGKQDALNMFLYLTCIYSCSQQKRENNSRTHCLCSCHPSIIVPQWVVVVQRQSWCWCAFCLVFQSWELSELDGLQPQTSSSCSSEGHWCWPRRDAVHLDAVGK